MEKPKTKLQRFAPGDRLFREGDKSREMYIIRSGRVRITISKNGKEIPITELGKGSFVGEMSLISGLPRTASVTAIEDVYANVVSSDVFENSKFGIPDWMQSIARTLVERIRKTTIILSDYIAVGDVPAIEGQRIENPTESFRIKENKSRNRIYLKGYFYKESINEVKGLIKKRAVGSNVTITIDFSEVVDIDREVVQYIKELTESSYASEGRIRITNIQLVYNKLSELKGVSSLIDAYQMKIRSLEREEILIKEGEIERSMYVVRTGKFEIFRTSEEGVILPLGTAVAGDVIGEMSLIREGTRSASVRAITSGSVYVVESKDFFHGTYNVPEWFMSVIRGLTERLRNTNEMLSTITAPREEEQEEKPETEPLTIIVDNKRCGYIILQGHFTLGNLDYFSAIVRRCMYRGEKNLVVDMRDIEEMDRASIRYLLHVYTALRQGGGSLKLLGNKEKITWLYKHKQEEAFE